MEDLKEALEAVKQAADAYDDASEELSTALSEVSDAMCNVEISHNVRTLLSKMISKSDPILEQGAEIKDSIDFILEELPEEEDELDSEEEIF